MVTFSANLGFLWQELTLPDAIRAAKSAGFDAVECHWPYDTAASEVLAALNETGLLMMGLNTARGSQGENGLSALVGREGEARAAIDQAVEYAHEIGAKNIHVMAGFASGDKARQCYCDNLDYACMHAATTGLQILIEPLNHYDAPGYFLNSTQQAVDIIKDVAADNLALMFDCYHVQRLEGDVVTRLQRLRPYIGHIQFASVPERHAPGTGELDYGYVFAQIAHMGWNRPLGAEYKPTGTTEDSLAWLQRYRTECTHI